MLFQVENELDASVNRCDTKNNCVKWFVFSVFLHELFLAASSSWAEKNWDASKKARLAVTPAKTYFFQTLLCSQNS